MRVTESAVAMKGSSSYNHYQETTSVVTQMSAASWKELQERQSNDSSRRQSDRRDKDDAAVISISDAARRRRQEREAGKTGHDRISHDNGNHYGRSKADKTAKELMENHPIDESELDPVERAESKDEQIIRILRRLTEILRQMRNGGKGRSFSNLRKEMTAEDMEAYDRKFERTMKRLGRVSLSGSNAVIDLTGSGDNGGSSRKVIKTAEERRLNRASGGNIWVRHTSKSSFVMEQESMTFSTTGTAKTADGREISFNLDLEMSRAFAGSIHAESLESYIMTDPLVINLDDSPAGLSDQKFYFDLDGDGKKDEISNLKKGSAFLAYDKNGDGVINDGSELFGTKSGDGFADLAAYDKDGNGWIDEGDDIYSKLKLWTKDENGNDKLIDLKEADVGAIYLGSASTDFHLNDAANKTNGMIRQTGIFLRESGEVGTVQHVDLAV